MDLVLSNIASNGVVRIFLRFVCRGSGKEICYKEGNFEEL